MSNLNLCIDIGVNGQEHRWRYIRRMFPGALPYVVLRGGDIVSYHLTFLDAANDVARLEFEDTRSGVGGSPTTVGFGTHDWPESEVKNRVVLVGEVNPYQDRRDFDLYDMPEKASGHRLREKILGVSREDYFRRFYRRNLCVWKWSLSAARDRSEDLRAEFPTNTFVLLGKKVQEAFSIDSRDSLRVVKRERTFVLIPHPSGLCRFWREPGAFERTRDVLRSAGAFCGPTQ